MSKTRDTGFLGNVVKVDNTGNVSFVSGSTTLLSISSSGAVTTTGVISGSNALSSSYALNADQVDGLNSTSFVFTSSYNTDSSSFSTRTTNLETASGSFSTRVTRIEGNYATTGSNVFLGAQTVCANITSTGTIIAQTLNVQQVTSSVVYSSGSNIFGCSLANTQQFTGSVLMTGSLTVTTSGTSPEFQVAVGGTTIGNALTDVHQVTGSLRMTGSNALFSVGCIGIGTTSPVTKLDVIGNARLFPASGDVNLSLRGFASQYINFTEASVADRGVIGFAIGSGDLVYRSGGYDMSTGTERMRITSAGIACFACQVCSAVGFYASSVQSGITIDSTTNGDTIIASRGLSSALHGIVRTVGQNGVTCAMLISTRSTVDGNLPASVNALWGLTNHDMVIATNNTERMRISSAGCIGINNNNPQYNLDLTGADNAPTSTYLRVYSNNRTVYTGIGYQRLETNGDLAIVAGATQTFRTGGTDRITIASTGITCFACQMCTAGVLNTSFRISNARVNGTWQEWVAQGITLTNNSAIALFCINSQYDNLIVDLAAWIDQGSWSPVSYRFNIGYNVGTSYVAGLGAVSAICGLQGGTIYNETWCWKNCSGNSINNSAISLRIFGRATNEQISTGGRDLIVSSYLTRVS